MTPHTYTQFNCFRRRDVSRTDPNVFTSLFVSGSFNTIFGASDNVASYGRVTSEL